jgi:potassium-transporting ATPase potassium-binding subunit
MTTATWTLWGVYGVLLIGLAWPLSVWMDGVMSGRWSLLRRIEAPIYRCLGTRPQAETGWKHYALGLLIFNTLGMLAVYALQRLQGILPLNPSGMPAVNADLAFNTAVSFVTNTNWQSYGGESTMSPLTQMLALTVQNFLSAATGMAVLVALIRGFARHSSRTVGQVWVDLTRATLWVLLPLSLTVALVFSAQGVVQSFNAAETLTPLETQDVGVGSVDAHGPSALKQERLPTPTLAVGPVASQLAIKMLGTNGGGFFNANSAHPFENPSAGSNLLQMLCILLIPTALCLTFGRMVGDVRQGRMVLGTMALVLIVMAVAATHFEQQGNPALTALGVDQAPSLLQSGGNMEGKETRFGIAASSLFSVLTTAASCGAVNAMHDSFTPLGGAVPLVLIQLGEVIFGGVGSGLYGMLVFAIVTVFIAGLMIGRTPEYLGKKIEVFEMKMVSIAVLVTPLVVLFGTALAAATVAGRSGVANPGAHGFTELLYAFSSAGNNNGSAFAGLSANTPFYNMTLAVAMWLGRFSVIVPVLAMAGSLATKKRLAVTEGTLPTHGPLFMLMLLGTVLLVGLLNYVPALALGPVAEHLSLWAR